MLEMKFKTILNISLSLVLCSCSCSYLDSDTDSGENGNGGDTGTGDAGDYPQEGTGETDGYTLVWQDLFDGNELDGDKWYVEVNGDGGGNAELQYYRSENVDVVREPVSGRGCLRLTARKESYGGKNFTSGRINTSDRFEFTYGKVEASIKLPSTANGLWPAFWLLGANYSEVSWPRCGEIDILEMGNSEGISKGTQDRFFNGACHWGTYQDNYSWYPNYAKSSTWDYSLQDGEFHLYTLIWDENYVRTYVDMDRYPDVEPYFEMGITDMSNEQISSGYYFHHDFFIILNLAVGGRFTGILNASGITALAGGEQSMYVDYVKVYQKK